MDAAGGSEVIGARKSRSAPPAVASSVFYLPMKLKARMEDWPSLRPVILHIYESEVPKVGRDMRSTSVGNYFVWLMLEGEVRVEHRDRVVHGRAGEWVVAHPGPRHQLFTPDARIISIQFQAKWPDGRLLFDEGVPLAFPASEAPGLEQRARELLRYAREVLPNDPFATRGTPVSLLEYFTFQHHGSAFLLALFAEMEARGLIPSRIGQIDERILQTLRRLDGWPLDLALDSGHIARPTGLTADHLQRLFQQSMGISPAKYFAGRRQDYARRQLGHSAIPVKVIASELGFRSIADFSAWFRRAQGCSPTAYRQGAMDAAEL